MTLSSDPNRQQDIAQSHTRRILVVDDEVRIGQLVARILGEQGYAVARATSGDAAMERLATDSFELVISDLKMPGMDGLTLSALIREHYPQTDIMILTAHGTIQNAVDAMKQGVLDYLIKPFNIDDLTAKVSNCFKERARRQNSEQDSPLRPLLELSRILSESKGLSDTMNRIIELVQRTFDPRCIEMVTFGNTPDDAITLAHHGASLKDWGLDRLGQERMQNIYLAERPWLLRTAGVNDPKGSASVGQCLTVPLVSGDQVAGEFTLVRGADDPPYHSADAELLQVFAFQIGVSLLQAQTRQRLLDTFRDLKRATLSTVESLFAALETYDPYTHAHSQRVSDCAYIVGQRLGLSESYVENLRIAGLLHDVGKLGIGEITLRKNGELTDTERDRIYMHPVMGARILEGIPALSQVVPLVQYHHERFDGTGYPARLAGEDIPLGARILAVVDTWDSMTSDRPYRAALPLEEARLRLQSSAGTQLDERLVGIWCEIMAQQTDVLEAALDRVKED